MPSLFDTSIYVDAFRRGENRTSRPMIEDLESPLWLSAVVLEELYAGATESDCVAVVELERSFNRIGKILVPTVDDWTEAGKVLHRLAAQYDYEKIVRGRLTNDALIAMGAARLGILIITRNARDFRRLAEFSHFRWQIASV